MRRAIRLLSGIALVVLLLGGCDGPDEPKPPGCRGLNGEQLKLSGPAGDASCVLGHGNTQSTDRKW